MGGVNPHLDINGAALLHPFPDLFNRIGCVSVEYFEMRDAVF